jgi:lysozyme family protein
MSQESPPPLEPSPKFNICLSFLLKSEGGYSSHPDDPGGATNLGISKASYPDEDIAGMTHERAAYLYWRDYWLPNRCEEMPYEVALAVFDFAVNAPAVASRMALQKVIGATPDGVLGPRSMKALSDIIAVMGSVHVALGVVDVRLVRYVRRVQAGISSRKFLLGWLRRLHDLITAIHKGELNA